MSNCSILNALVFQGCEPAYVNSLRAVKTIDKLVTEIRFDSEGIQCEDMRMSDQRFIDLEIKLSHHEQMLEDLSAVIFRQQQQIDTLEVQLKTLKEQMKSSKDGIEVGPADDKPPHY